MAEVIAMPKLGFDMAEGTLVRWVKSEGESVEKGELLAEIETDKATVEVESTHTGVVRRHIVETGTAVPVGDPIAVVGEEGEEIDWDALLGGEPEEPAEEAEAEAAPEADRAPAREAAAPSPDGARLPGGVRASPVARRMAEEEGVDLSTLDGSGPGGRVVKQDVEAYLEERVRAPERKPAAPTPAPAMVAEPLEDRRVPLSKLRATIGRRMTESRQEAPHFYVTHQYEMGALMALRKQVNALLEAEGAKTSVNDYIVRACALALRSFPNLNASLEGDQIHQHGEINVGVAVAVENGLMNVVCRNADMKSVRQIASELGPMVERARSGRVKPDDIEGSTFTVSNLGMFDVEEFTAIINPPEAAILAVGSVQKVPVVEGDELAIGSRMNATISVDHRVSDGAEAARFLQELARFLEEPMRLLV